ncbi:MAG: hypothetical protein K0R50_622 [Eubacterium sp.]|jgi:uncharacterized membrane protein YfcA|nr:hypothetical protein [Eubacterium sp.]
METNIYLFVVVLVAYIIKSLTGFGNTLIINSLLSFVKENRFISPVDLLLGIPANIYMAWKDRRSIDLKIVIPLSILVLLGNIPGIFLLNIGGDKLLKSILGVVLILLAIEMFTRKSTNNKADTSESISEVENQKVPQQKHKGSENTRTKTLILYAVGLISGVLMGLYGIGVLLAAFIGRQTDNRNNYRGNLCIIFVVDNLFRFVMYCINGLISWNILFVSLGLAPALLIGMFIGRKIDSRISDSTVKKFVTALLLVSGVAYILMNRFGAA